MRTKDEGHEGGEGRMQTCKRVGGVPSSGEMKEESDISNLTAKNILSGLGWLDRFLSLFIILAMILGVVIGVFAPNVREHLNKGNLKGVSAPLVVGLIVMMWPILTKVSSARWFVMTSWCDLSFVEHSSHPSSRCRTRRSDRHSGARKFGCKFSCLYC